MLWLLRLFQQISVVFSFKKRVFKRRKKQQQHILTLFVVQKYKNAKLGGYKNASNQIRTICGLLTLNDCELAQSGNMSSYNTISYGAVWKPWRASIVLTVQKHLKLNVRKYTLYHIHPTKTRMHLGISAVYLEFVCLFVLRFYGPVNPMGSCRARSVYLTTRLLGRLSPLSG